MRSLGCALLCPALVIAMVSLAASPCAAAPIFSLIDLGAATGSPSVPDSLLIPRTANSSGESLVNPPAPVGGTGPFTVRAELLDAQGHLTPVGDLGVSGGSSYALAINSGGQVVGRWVDAQGVDHGFLYTNYQSLEISALIPPFSPPFPTSPSSITAATNIDDQGRILAIGMLGGVPHTVLLTPVPSTVPEPTTLVIFGLVAAAGFARTRLNGVRGHHRIGR